MNYLKYYNYYLNSLTQLLLPFTCILCNRPAHRLIDLCQACENELPFIANACFRCGIDITHVDPFNKKLCGECLRNPPLYHNTFALYHYQPPIDKLITGIKFSGKLVYARVLGELLTKNITLNPIAINKHPDCIIPMPLHKKRLRERGFNQALEIARPIAKFFKIPLDFHSCVRSRETNAQSLIPANMRENNIKDAFTINKNFSARRVIILDDVVTTGSTVAELSKLLLRQGVEEISVWCCARTKLQVTSQA